MAKSGGRKRRPQGCSLRSHRLRRLKPLTPTLSPATHSAIPSMLPCCTSDLKRRLNTLLMRYGYPIAIITKADRSRYYDSLEESQCSDLTALTSLISECVEESLEEYEAAAKEQLEHIEWTQSIVAKLQRSEEVRATNQYEVWRNAMELLKSIFKQTAEMLHSSAKLAEVWFKDFGQLDLEKYLTLTGNSSAKRTWFFRIDFRSGERTDRYLFFFRPFNSEVQRADFWR